MASNRALKRLQKEFKTITDLQKQGTDTGWSAGPVNEDLFKWKGFLFGPEKSPFEGGVFEIQINFPTDYPIKAPVVTFVTVPYHPNVYTNGKICLDILADQWTAALQIDQLLQSIRSLLTDPNPSSPANPDAANLYSQNRAKYDEKVRAMIATANGGSSSSTSSTSSTAAATRVFRHPPS